MALNVYRSELLMDCRVGLHSLNEANKLICLKVYAMEGVE